MNSPPPTQGLERPDTKPRAVVVVPAGGTGQRMGGTVPKQFLELGGLPLLVHTLRALAACPSVMEIVPVVPGKDREAVRGMIQTFALEKVADPVAGGASRQISVANGLVAVTGNPEVIAVHDAARPFPDPATLDRAIARAADGVGVVVGCPAKDTLKQVDDAGRVTGTPDRSRLWQAFTPQVFPAKMIVSAYEQGTRNGFQGTDDASLAEHAGHVVEMIEGGREALKVTTPLDLEIARAWIK